MKRFFKGDTRIIPQRWWISSLQSRFWTVATALLGGVAGTALAAGEETAALPAGDDAFVIFQELSDPYGIFISPELYVLQGSTVVTRNAPLTTPDYAFVEWEFGPQAHRDALGVSLTQIQLVANDHVTVTARYLPIGQDTLGDGVNDATKLRFYGDVMVAATSDTDGDGFDFATELARGYHPHLHDAVVDGGLVVRSSATVAFNFNFGMVSMVQRSEPEGIVNVITEVEPDTLHALAHAPAQFGDYRFIGWFHGEERLDDPFAWQPPTVRVTHSEHTFIARYIASTEDADGDGLPDYLEWYYFNSLGTVTPDSDLFGDGIPLAVKIARGYHPLLASEPVDGGLVVRSSAVIEVNNGLSAYAFRSEPVGLYSQDGLALAGEVKTSPGFALQQFSGYGFGYWTIDGIPQRGADGIALGSVALTVGETAEAVAHFFLLDEDSDADGIPDWLEYYYYGDLTRADAATDDDGDGFGLAEELARGYHPFLADELVDGGLVVRSSGLVTVLFNLVGWGNREQLAVPDELAELDLSGIVAGGLHNLVLAADGTVYAWGQDEDGQASVPEFDEPVLKIAAGYSHNIALLESGVVHCWGLNIHRQATPPRNLRNVVYIAAGRDHSLAIDAKGKVYAWGRNSAGQSSVPQIPRPAIAVAGGLAHNLVLLDDFSVFAWGNNNSGQCDVPPNLPEIIMVAAGNYHSLALDRFGRLHVWGDPEHDQLELPERVRLAGTPSPGAGSDILMPMSGDRIVGISAGDFHSVVLFDDGSVASWGDNTYGQSTPPASLRHVREVSAGSEHSMALVADPTGAASPVELQLTAIGGAILREPFRTQYSSGEAVSFLPQTLPGYVFAGWSGAASGNAVPLALTLDGDTVLHATFNRIPGYRLELITGAEPSHGGQVVVQQPMADYPWDASVAVSAVAAEGYRFVGWLGDLNADSASVTLLMDGHKEVLAMFEPVSDSPETAYQAWWQHHFGHLPQPPELLLKEGRWVSPATAYLLGDDPFDPNDFLRPVLLPGSPDGFDLRFPTLVGRMYHVQQSQQLGPEAIWQPLGQPIEGDGNAKSVAIPAASSAQFYRIKISERP